MALLAPIATSLRSPCFWISLFVLLLMATSCQVMGDPPRLATATAQAQLTPLATPEPLVLSLGGDTAVVPTAATRPPAQPNPALTVWVNETSPDHETAVRAIAAGFSQTAGVDVVLRFVAPGLLPELVETAIVSDSYALPDIIIHPLEYTVGWAERGALNTAAAEAALERIGRDTFNPEALALVQVDGQTAALPSDGYHQLLLYRQDWFTERGLATPDNYAAMLAAAEAIYDRENLRSGFVIPTESNLVTTHQAFEHLAAANGCQLLDAAGEVLLLQPACQEAINFYYNIVHQFSPIGVQTDTSARNAYLEGRTGMIMASPRILPMLAGLDAAYRPTCPECLANPEHLAENSGIITAIRGSGTTAAEFGEIVYLGITSAADPETAVAFAEYWFNEGYETWLAVEPERKVPMRLGTAAEPQRFINAWAELPLAGSDLSLADIFDQDTVSQLRDGIAESQRWGFREGQGGLMAMLYQKLTFSVVLQEMLSGYFSVDKTIFEAYNRVVDLMPNYAFSVVLEPTLEPTPENE
ncbi:MAG: extracellular solute-binding protein [Chloroflexi bacterium]|nr:extracellular solute-binding protein [Chloroflexota bacterium]